MFYYLIALAVILIDQVTKWMIVKEMYYGQSITVI
ncbi:signal peptidase II, partial [Priestia megaterium]